MLIQKLKTVRGHSAGSRPDGPWERPAAWFVAPGEPPQQPAGEPSTSGTTKVLREDVTSLARYARLGRHVPRRGRVIDHDGTPIANAAIYAHTTINSMTWPAQNQQQTAIRPFERAWPDRFGGPSFSGRSTSPRGFP